MNVTGPSSYPADLGRFRGYLVVLARSGLARDLCGRLDASDVVQQTLLEAHRDHASFRGRTVREQLVWLRQILSHNLVNAGRDLRRAKRDIAREQSLDAALERSSIRLEHWMAAQTSSPSNRAWVAERTLRVAEALASLPDDVQEVIVLRHCEELGLEEIGARIGVSRNTVARRLREGLAALRQTLEGIG